MILILSGAPGAGKGTQGDLLVQRRGYKKISTGDALRRQVKDGSEVGKSAAAYMEKGQLVPDDVLLRVLDLELGKYSDGEVLLLDGYPRNLAQAESLAHLSYKIGAFLHLDVNRDKLIERLAGRRVCHKCEATFHVTDSPSKRGTECDRCGGKLEQRKDDTSSSVAVRLEVYDKITHPVMDFYKKQGMYRRVEGVGSFEDVYKRLEQQIGTL